MKYTLSRTDDRELVKALHTICMPGDSFDLGDQLWVCHDETDTPVAFCSARKTYGDSVFLSRAGVLPCANGNKLQRRMIHARVKWAREIGADSVVTYTLYDNHASIVSLLKAGFNFYHPSYAWAGRAVHYFCKDL